MQSPGRRLGLTWLLLPVALVIGWMLARPGPMSGLVRVSDETCYDFHLHLDEAVPLSGFPSRRWIQRGTRQHAFLNRDTALLPLYVPFAGELLFPHVPIHEHATLTWQAGIEPEPFNDLKPMPASGRRCRFEVVLRPAGRPEIVIDQVSVVLADARGTLSEMRTCAIATDVGDHVDIVLRTVGEVANEPSALWFLPTWRSPVIRSDGKRERLERQHDEVTTLADDGDLLQTFRTLHEAATPETRVLIQRRLPQPHGEAADITVPAIEFVPNFDAAPDPNVDHGGECPAMVFAASGSAELPRVAIPKDGELRFAVGLEGFAPHLRDPAGAATLRVLVDGTSAWERRIAGQDGWLDVVIPLANHGGGRVDLAFAVTLDPFVPQPVSVIAVDLVTANTVPEQRDLLVRRAAFARPRIVTHRQQPRRLSGEGQANIIVLVSETLRADHLGCYGSKLGNTPEIDALAKRALLYERAYAASSWTLASTASILTGRDPLLHGAVKEDRGFLSDANVTLGEAAQAMSVTTAAFTTNDFLRRETNFDQGFATFAYRRYANARQLNQLFFDWLADHQDVQFLAYLHYWDPHDPCNAPGELERKHVRDDLKNLNAQEVEGSLQRDFLHQVAAPPLTPEMLLAARDKLELVKGLYQGEIEYLDRHVGELVRHIEQAGLAGKTYIIFTSDHGEELLEHGWWGHGSFLFDESLHVPLLILGPNVKPGRVSEPVENLRVYQTALELLGDQRGEWEQRGPLPPWGESRSYAFASTWKGIRTIQPRFTGKQLYAVQNDRQKLILETDDDLKPLSLTLFDLPGEQNARSVPATPKSDLEKALRTWLGYCYQKRSVMPAALSPAQAENLKGLGYIGPGSGVGTGSGK